MHACVPNYLVPEALAFSALLEISLPNCYRRKPATGFTAAITEYTERHVRTHACGHVSSLRSQRSLR